MTPSKLPVIHLMPGEFRLSRNPEIIITILGSCVALIMYDTVTEVCAIAHCVLPESSFGEGGEENNAFKYVDSSFIRMMEIFQRMGIPPERIVMKLFGGAEQVINHAKGRESVGLKNIKKVLELAGLKSIRVASSDVGGNIGRKIYLLSNTGEVLLTRLKKTKLKQFQYEKDKSFNS